MGENKEQEGISFLFSSSVRVSEDIGPIFLLSIKQKKYKKKARQSLGGRGAVDVTPSKKNSLGGCGTITDYIFFFLNTDPISSNSTQLGHQLFLRDVFRIS